MVWRARTTQAPCQLAVDGGAAAGEGEAAAQRREADQLLDEGGAAAGEHCGVAHALAGVQQRGGGAARREVGHRGGGAPMKLMSKLKSRLSYISFSSAGMRRSQHRFQLALPHHGRGARRDLRQALAHRRRRLHLVVACQVGVQHAAL